MKRHIRGHRLRKRRHRGFSKNSYAFALFCCKMHQKPDFEGFFNFLVEFMPKICYLFNNPWGRVFSPKTPGRKFFPKKMVFG